MEKKWNWACLWWMTGKEKISQSNTHTHPPRVPVSGVAEPLSDERHLQLQRDTDTGQCANTGRLQGARPPGGQPSRRLSPFRGHYSDELLLKPGWGTGYLFGKTTVSLFCRNHHRLHHHGSWIPSGCPVPEALWERLRFSTHSSRGKKPSRTTPNTQKKKRKEMVKFYIFWSNYMILSEIILRFQIIHTLYTLNEDLFLGIKHCLLRAFQRVTENLRKTVFIRCST